MFTIKRKLEYTNPEEPFLDRLMVKNFKIYQHDVQSRLRMQEHSADAYRRPLQDQSSFEALAYKDEIKAKQHSEQQQ